MLGEQEDRSSSNFIPSSVCQQCLPTESGEDQGTEGDDRTAPTVREMSPEQ